MVKKPILNKKFAKKEEKDDVLRFYTLRKQNYYTCRNARNRIGCRSTIITNDKDEYKMIKGHNKSCLNQMKKLLNVEKEKCSLCNAFRENEIVKCINCEKFYHSGCISSSSFAFTKICVNCTNTINDKRLTNKNQIFYEDVNNIEKLKESYKNKINCLKKTKKPEFKLLNYIEEPLKPGIFKAFYSKNLKFHDELIKNEYNNILKELPTQDKKTFYEAKLFTLNGNYGPIDIDEDENQGFVVKATDDIKKFSFICEYAGEVIKEKDENLIENDSIFMLDNGLLINPFKISNIGRFISGVNSNDKISKEKINLKTLRTNIDGETHIILHSIKDIKKGEILYYDYNGCENMYPTDNFI